MTVPCGKLGGAEHPQSLVIDHLVLGLRDFDFLGAAQEPDAVEVDVGVGDSIYGQV